MEEMNQTQTAEKLRSSSEYIRAAESFARYASEEWIKGSDDRALLMLCVDRTENLGGTGRMGIVVGDRDLVATGLTVMMGNDEVGDAFRRARLASDMAADMDGNIRNASRRLHHLYWTAACAGAWALGLIALTVSGLMHWMFGVSNLLLMMFLGVCIFGTIRDSRRTLDRMKSAVRRDRRERAEYQKKAFCEALKNFLQHEDDDDE